MFYVCLILFITEQYSFLWLNSLLILSPFDGRFSCYEHWCTDLCVDMFYFSWVSNLGLELLSCMVSVCLTSHEMSRWFSKVIVPALFEKCTCSAFSSELRIVSLFNFSHFSVCVAVSHSGLIFIPRMTNDVEQLFMCLLAIHMSLWSVCWNLFARFQKLSFSS